MERTKLRECLREKAFYLKEDREVSLRSVLLPSQRRLCALCRRAVRKYRRGEVLTSSEKWLCDNALILEERLKGLSRIKTEIHSGVYRLFLNFFLSCDTALEEGDLETVFDFCRRENVKEDVFVNLGALLTSAAAAAICISMDEGEDRAGIWVKTIRMLEKADLSGLVSAYCPLEEILRQDPAGAYPKMEYAFRARLCERVRRLARRRGMDTLEYAEELLKQAVERGGYIGEGISEPRKFGFLYSACVTVFGLLLGTWFSFVLAKEYPFGAAALIAFLLAGQGAAGACIAFFDALFSKLVPSESLWRVHVHTLDDDQRTLVVYTALATTTEEIAELCERLKRAYYASFVPSRGEQNLSFALLLDLRESDDEIEADDTILYEAARAGIEALNRELSGCFLLFVRARRRNANGRYSGWERKRGALLALSDLIAGRKSELVCLAGEKERAVGVKYFLTLDSDTEITPGSVQEMVGILEHPLNRAVISEKRGVPQVVRGHAVLQPLIVPTTESARRTPFSVLQSGAGGMTAYSSAAFDRAQTLFSRGHFCGKGMILAEAFDRVVRGAFPDNAVLSHDLLEGARLNCAGVTDLVFLDEVPPTPRVHSERAHRWCRGDVQALFFSGFFAKGRDGRRHYNPIPFYYRSALWDNFRRAVLPVFSAVLLLVSPFVSRVSGRILMLSALLPYVTSALVDILYLIASSRARGLFRRFVSPAASAVWQRILSFFYALSSIFWEAYLNLDAILRALWRMSVSGKKRLEWKTAAASARGGKETLRSYVCTRACCLIAGVFLLVFSAQSPIRLIAFLSCLHPLIAWLVAKPFSKKHEGLACDREVLREYVRDLSRFFLQEVGERTHHLPPDHLTTAPVRVRALRTSPTNIGMYLVSLCAMVDFELISLEECLSRLEKTLSSVEQLPVWRTLLYNWYDLESMQVLSPAYVSSVDCGNYLASLAALWGFLKEQEEEGAAVASLLGRVERLLDQAQLKHLYRSSCSLFSIGLDVSSGRLDPSNYDLYMSEARLTSYFAVARGEVPLSHWSALSRPLISRGSFLGAASFSGTAFEYFMPLLFLPLCRASFEEEALAFAAREQRRAGRKTKIGHVFGVSESAYASLDASGDYPYRANGVGALALRRDAVGTDVISPYSSFLMLPVCGRAAMENLSRLARLGLYGEYGFYESAQIHSNGCDVVKSFFAHHTGMSIVAAANAAFDNVFCRRFLSYGPMRAMLPLVCERIPAEAAIRKRDYAPSSLSAARALQKTAHFDVLSSKPSALVVPSKEATLYFDDCGYFNVLWRRQTPILLFCPMNSHDRARGGLVVRALVGDRIYSSVPGENPETCRMSACTVPGGVLLTLSDRALVVRFCVCLSGAGNALLVESEIVGEAGHATVSVSFETLLKSEAEYHAHPAFSSLSLSVQKTPKALFLSCRQKKPLGEVSLSVCDETGGRIGVPGALWGQALEDLGGAKTALVSPASAPCPAGATASPRVFCRRTLSSPEFVTHLSHRFCLGFAEGEHAAYHRALSALKRRLDPEARREDERNVAGFLRRAGESAALSDPSSRLCRSITHAIFSARRVRLISSQSLSFRREDLYRYAISGDLPIVLYHRKGEGDRRLLETLVSLHRFHAICGMHYDLVLFDGSAGYLRQGMRTFEQAIEKAGSAYLSGVRGGVFCLEGDARLLELLEDAACLSLSESEHVFSESAPRGLITEVGGVPEAFFEEAAPFPRHGVGRFLSEGFLIEKDRFCPAENFSHLIASSTFGALVTHRSLGFTFETSSRFRRLTRADNDPYLRSFGERLVLRFSPERAYDLAAVSSKVLFSPGYAQYFGEVEDVQYRLTVFCHPTLLFRGVEAEFYGNARFELSYEIEPVLGDENGVLGSFFADLRDNTLVFSRAISPLSRPFSGYLKLVGESAARAGEGLGLSCQVHLDGKREVQFYLGAKESGEQFSRVEEYLSKVPFVRLFCESTGALRNKLPPPVVREEKAGNEARADFINRYLPYQAITSRLSARCGFYQPGGAHGFRDQLQDALMYLEYDPAKCASVLLRHAAHQFSEGDVLHWWHNLPDENGRHRGVRTRISDDYLWLIYTAAAYVKKTGDFALLEREVPFLTGRALSPGEKDLYESFSFGEKESLWAHLTAAADLFVSRGVGAHGLPLMLGGDWNDGFDALGEGAESVFLAEFGAICLYRLSRLMLRCGRSVEKAAGYEAFAHRLHAAQQRAFGPGWFARAYFGDGEVLGADESLSTSCSIDVLPQAFAAFLYLQYPQEERTPEELSRVISSLSAVWEHLYDRENGVLKLFDPPFAARGRQVGYIRAYAPGVRENGGQYTHAAIWYAFACRAIAPHTDDEALWRARADEVAEALLPYRAALSAQKAQRYRLEPYALAGDVWSSPGQEGRCGWNHYTGSAAWVWRYFATEGEENPV